jgi:hypothetical protein
LDLTKRNNDLLVIQKEVCMPKALG